MKFSKDKTYKLTKTIYLEYDNNKKCVGWTTKQVENHNGIIKKDELLKFDGYSTEYLKMRILDETHYPIAEFDEEELNKFVGEKILVEK